jgi:3-phosphoshikimate 1-carboxyvinyltransferase
VQAPASKSYTIRGLMCAALAHGRSSIAHPLESDDTEAALRVLREIGVRAQLNDSIWQIEGGNFQSSLRDLFCGDSAATLRFMSAIAAQVPGKNRLTAGTSLSKRPVKTLVDALKRWGVDISSQGEGPPITIYGGQFKGGLTELPGNISSQYVSALLLIAPLAQENTTIWLTTSLESRSYILMTIECLRQFGIEIKHSEELMEYEISPQRYKPAQYQVEGDWSSASYLLGLGAVGGEMEVGNISSLSIQGDKAIVDFLKEMGAHIEVNRGSIMVKRKQLKAIKADLNDCIDLLPTMSTLAALAQGTSEFTGIQRARLKESNRVKTVKEGLKRTGIKVIEELDKLTIIGGKPANAVVDAQNDHRIAMAFSLLGVAENGITIQGAECVSKTYPEYWNTLRNLGVKIDEQ